MNVFTSTELASKTKAVCATVREDGCAFVTNNGKIDCMMIDLSMFDTINEAIHSYDQWSPSTSWNACGGGTRRAPSRWPTLMRKSPPYALSAARRPHDEVRRS